MSRTARIANLIGVVVPFVGVIVGIGLLWNRAVDGVDMAILGAMYLLTAVGVTVGFHRLLTHRAFQAYPWLERTFAVLGSLSVQGSVMDWVADHRKHHAHADKEGDPTARMSATAAGYADCGMHIPVGCSRPRVRRTGSVTPASSMTIRACGGSEGAFRCSCWSRC